MKTKDFPRLRRQAIDDIIVHLNSDYAKNTKGYAKHYDMFLTRLQSPEFHSFLLPLEGEIVKHTTPVKLSYEDLRLPFDNCVFEYEVKHEKQYDKDGREFTMTHTIVIVQKWQVDDGTCILVLPLWRIMESNGVSYWTPPMNGLALLPTATISVNGDSTIDVSGFTVIGSSWDKAQERYKEMQVKDAISNISMELSVVAHFAMLCGCDNITAKKVHTVDKKLAKRTAERNGTPHNDYWMLDVYMNEEYEGSESGSGGSHSSPRFHVRRGHIRRYQTGKTTWVKQHTVGTPELGVIKKDYRVMA